MVECDWTASNQEKWSLAVILLLSVLDIIMHKKHSTVRRAFSCQPQEVSRQGTASSYVELGAGSLHTIF